MEGRKPPRSYWRQPSKNNEKNCETDIVAPENWHKQWKLNIVVKKLFYSYVDIYQSVLSLYWFCKTIMCNKACKTCLNISEEIKSMKYIKVIRIKLASFCYQKNFTVHHASVYCIWHKDWHHLHWRCFRINIDGKMLVKTREVYTLKKQQHKEAKNI